VTTIATTLLFAAIAVAPIWDGAIFRQALREALSSDPELAQPIDEAPAGCESSSPSTMTCLAGIEGHPTTESTAATISATRTGPERPRESTMHF
jgi:hypothetical protein